MAGGEGEADGVGEFADPAADLEELEPEGVELVGGGLGGGEPTAEGVEEPEDGGVEEEAKGVGPEAMVREAVAGQGVLEILDAVLGSDP